MQPDVSYEQALEVLRQSAPRDMLIHGESIQRNLKVLKAPKFVHKFYFGDPDENGVTTPGDFLRGPLIRTPGKSIFIRGGSGLGKTYFALAHFRNPLLVSDIDDLKKFRSDHDGIVFDDMSFLHRPPESVIHLVDQDFERSIRCRHANAVVPANTAKIFTHNNPNPFFDVLGQNAASPEQQIAIMRRLDCYYIPYSLFKAHANGNVIVPYSLLDKMLNKRQTDVYLCTGEQ